MSRCDAAEPQRTADDPLRTEDHMTSGIVLGVDDENHLRRTAALLWTYSVKVSIADIPLYVGMLSETL